MRKILVIAARDYSAAVKTKAFVISLLLMPIMMLGGIAAQALLHNVEDTRPKRVVIVDRTNDHEISDALVAASQRRNSKEIFDLAGRQNRPAYLLEVTPAQNQSAEEIQDRGFALSERIRSGELLGFVEIAPDVYDPKSKGDAVAYYTNQATYVAFEQWMSPIVTEAVRTHRAKSAGLAPEVVRQLVSPVSITSKDPYRKNPITGKVEKAAPQNRIASVLAPVMMVMLMFMMVMVGATPLIQGVVEEKGMRIAEVLLGSVSPFQLMLGKLVGTVGVSLTLAAVYLGGAFWAAQRFGLADRLPPATMVFFVCFQVMAVLMFGSVFISIGAACTDARETQSMMMPVMLVLVFPMFLLGYLLQNPTSTVSRALSWFPPATPMVMSLRMGAPPGVAIWEILGAMTLMLAMTLFFVWAAGRIFRVGILMQGKGARFGEMIRWVISG